MSLLLCGDANFQGGKHHLFEHALPMCASGFKLHHEVLEREQHAGGRLNAPVNVYDSVTRGVVGEVGRFLPANKREVQDDKAAFVEYKSETENYKNRTDIVINTLVAKINSLTPV